MLACTMRGLSAFSNSNFCVMNSKRVKYVKGYVYNTLILKLLN